MSADRALTVWQRSLVIFRVCVISADLMDPSVKITFFTEQD